jgi:hypothetical protein
MNCSNVSKNFLKLSLILNNSKHIYQRFFLKTLKNFKIYFSRIFLRKPKNFPYYLLLFMTEAKNASQCGMVLMKHVTTTISDGFLLT